MILRLSFLLLIPCLALAEISGESSQLELDDEQLEILESGEVVFLEPEGKNMVSAVIRIEADPELIWEVMLDQERIPKYVKELRESEILEQGENWKIIKHKLKMHPLLPRFEYVFREEYGPGHTVTFNRLSGAFRELNGSWNLVSQEESEHPFLAYTTYVDFGWYVPKTWVRNGINKKVPALLEAFREEVYSEVASRAEGRDQQ